MIKVALGLVPDGSYPFERPSPTRGDATMVVFFTQQIDHYQGLVIKANKMDCAPSTKLKRVFGTELHPEKEGEHVRASSLLGLLTVATNFLGGAFAETFVLQGKPVVADKVVTIGDFKGCLLYTSPSPRDS